MATFDRWDICAAWNVYSMLWGGDGCRFENAIQCRLSAIRYRPAISEQSLAGLSENAREIYDDLVQAHQHCESGYVACECCGEATMGYFVRGRSGPVNPGTQFCDACREAGCNEQESGEPCLCDDGMPEDYETCGYCGFDHEYEHAEAVAWHTENPGQGYDEEGNPL